MGNEIWENCGEFGALFECMYNMFSRNRASVEFAVHKYIPAELYGYEHDLLDLCDFFLQTEKESE